MEIEGQISDGDFISIGEVEFDIHQRAVQTFRLPSSNQSFRNVRVKILSNWGHPNYTCIYRVRVHGCQI